MFSRWGAFVYRFRRPIVLIAIVAAIASTTLASQASSALSAGGWLDANPVPPDLAPMDSSPADPALVADLTIPAAAARFLSALRPFLG
jgi:hypothetical protein